MPGRRARSPRGPVRCDRTARTRRPRDIEVPGPGRRTTSATRRSVIVTIGIDRYHHQQWSSLGNAVRDATSAAHAFERLGFAQPVAPILDRHATRDAIMSLVTDDLCSLGRGDSLILFYAGHGFTRRTRLGDEVIQTGYLIPADATDKVATWLDLDSWLRAVSLLPPRHILVILDACHCGIALDPIARWRGRGAWPGSLASLMARRSRRIITSALADQVASDTGPVRGHSLFTGCLIEGLTAGIQTQGRQVATGSELGMYLQRRVGTYPRSRQTPDFGAFAFDDRGELVIPLTSATGEGPRARARSART